MKTKPFTPAAAAPVDVSFAIDLPSYISLPGAQPLGPYPLAVCMLRGLELAKTTTPFIITREEGTLLLALENGHVHGEPVVVQTFMHQIELAKLFFQ